MPEINESPVVKAEMLIRKPVEEVFEAFVDPAITTRFWFTRSSGRLEAGKQIRWDWDMYGVGDDLVVRTVDLNRSLVIEWSDGTVTEWEFAVREENETFVTITHTGFKSTGDELLAQAVDSMGGYTMVLCGLKALLEHNIQLNLVADKAQDAHVPGWNA